jgi:hypothetical protein
MQGFQAHEKVPVLFDVLQWLSSEFNRHLFASSFVNRFENAAKAALAENATEGIIVCARRLVDLKRSLSSPFPSLNGGACSWLRLSRIPLSGTVHLPMRSTSTFHRACRPLPLRRATV